MSPAITWFILLTANPLIKFTSVSSYTPVVVTILFRLCFAAKPLKLSNLSNLLMPIPFTFKIKKTS